MSATTIWKVDGENKYFKRLNSSDWAEYHNGRHVFSFKFVRSQGDEVILRKTDGSYLKFNSRELLMGWGENSYNRLTFI